MTTSLLALCLAGAGTYALRAGSVRLFGAQPMRDRVERALRHAAVGIMAALIVTALAGRPSMTEVTAAQAVGLLCAVVACRRTSNITLVMATGLAAYVITGALT